MKIIHHLLATIFTVAILQPIFYPHSNITVQSLILAVAFGVLIDLDHIPAYWLFSKKTFTLHLVEMRNWYLLHRPRFPFVFFHEPIVAVIIATLMLNAGEPMALVTYAMHLLLDQIDVIIHPLAT